MFLFICLLSVVVWECLQRRGKRVTGGKKSGNKVCRLGSSSSLVGGYFCLWHQGQGQTDDLDSPPVPLYGMSVYRVYVVEAWEVADQEAGSSATTFAY